MLTFKLTFKLTLCVIARGYGVLVRCLLARGGFPMV